MRHTMVVITAGLNVLSSSRMLADQLAVEARAQLLGISDGPADGDIVLKVVELRELALDIADKFATGTTSPALQQALDTVYSADALIAVTPVFSASYSGLFKSFVDVLDPKSLEGVPVALGATGGSARHALVVDTALRSLFSYLRTVQVPTGIFAAPEDWEGAQGQLLAERIQQAGRELALLMVGRPVLPMSIQRQAGSAPMPQVLLNHAGSMAKV